MGNNIYISFTSENSAKDPWVSEFLNYLKGSLTKITKLLLTLRTNLDDGDDPEMQLQNARVIVLVFNGFVSDDFARTLRFIENNFQNLNDKEVDVFLVVKSGKFNSVIPVTLRNLITYNFYEYNVRTGEIIDFSPIFGGEKENKFWAKLTDLTYDIIYNLEGPVKKHNEKELSIYLAEVSKDQIPNREILRRELLLLGYKVLPSKSLPASYKDYQEVVLEQMKECDASIHILGEIYGDAPSGSDYSYQEIQNRVVSDSFKKPENPLKKGFYRFVWLPPSLEPYDEKQIQYLKRLKRELSDSKFSELIQSGIEEFKELFNSKAYVFLNPHAEKEEIPLSEIILLITDSINQPLSSEVEKLIRNSSRRYEVLDLNQTGEMLPINLFKQKVGLASSAIIVNNNSDALWLQGILGLTIKNLNQPGGLKRVVAAVSVTGNKDVLNSEAYHISFFNSTDNMSKNIENFLNQLN
jgi:hypothetical protein